MDEIPTSVMKKARTAINNLQNEVNGKLVHTSIGGSYAYGTWHEESDIDIRGIYVAPINDFLSLRRVQESHDYKNPDTVLYELNKFAFLAMNANPNALEMVYAPTLATHKAFRTMHDQRDIFLSQFARVTYRGYAKNQLMRVVEGEEKGRLQPKNRTKHLVHCFRLLEQGLYILENGTIDLTMSNYEDTLELVKSDTDVLVKEFEAGIQRMDDCKSDLPDFPDADVINELILDLRWSLN